MGVIKNHTITFKNNETGEVTGKVNFNWLDEHRLVSPNTTAHFIIEIERKLETLRGMLSNINKDIAEQKGRYFFLKRYIQKWSMRLTLVPENLRIDKDNLLCNHFVLENYKMLLPDRLISYDKALFLLLGLNTTSLDNHMLWEGFTIYEYSAVPTTPNNYVIEQLFFDSEQNKCLRDSAYITPDRKIDSKNLIKLGKQYGFFSNNGVINARKKPNNGQIKNDDETGIPLKRLRIYQETLQKYLETRNNPVSIRELTISTDESKIGEYAIQNSQALGVEATTMRQDLLKLVKSEWWNSLPSKTRKKLKK